MSVHGFTEGAPHTRLANSIRRTIESGAASLSREERALFAGLVYGDDRLQTPLTADDFQAAGLSHLLAVSGQNVAFVLAIVGPVLRRIGHRERFLFVLGVLVLFATVTRFEASVVRASVMTAVAALGSLVGTEAASQRVLSIAVAGLIMVQPLLVHSVAFQLSVAASAGILLWSARIALMVPGPRLLAESLAVTSSAQVAVAPLLVWHFDGLPVASLPANLLAGPVAGPVMMWGLTAGFLAGLMPGFVGELVHVPVRVALWWLTQVAAQVPRLPLGYLGAPHIAALWLGGGVALRWRGGVGRTVATAAIVGALVTAAGAAWWAPRDSVSVAPNAMVWRDDSHTVVHLASRVDPEDVLAGLRKHGVGTIDALIVERSTFANARLIGWMRTRHNIVRVIAPTNTMGVGELVVTGDVELHVDGFDLRVSATDDKIAVTPTPALGNPSQG